MKTAHVLLGFFFVLAMGLAAYGASIDRFAMLIGMLPGMVGLIGLCIWATSPDGIAAESHAQYAQGLARRERSRREHAKHAGYVYVSARGNQYLRNEYDANRLMARR